MSDDEKIAKVVSLMGSTKPKPAPRRKPSSGTVVNIKARDGDGHGIGNTIIKTEKVVNRTVATPLAGVEHITEAQVRRLHDLKDEILKLEAAGKRNPATPMRVWAALNKKMGVGAMRMIPLAKFKAAENYLLTWIGQLMDRSSVQKKEPDVVEKRRISYIQTNIKKLDIEDKVRDYMEKHFGVRSLIDLPDMAALERVYRYVSGVKKKFGVQ
jgi:hypothetical protein